MCSNCSSTNYAANLKLKHQKLEKQFLKLKKKYHAVYQHN